MKDCTTCKLYQDSCTLLDPPWDWRLTYLERSGNYCEYRTPHHAKAGAPDCPQYQGTTESTIPDQTRVLTQIIWS